VIYRRRNGKEDPANRSFSAYSHLDCVDLLTKIELEKLFRRNKTERGKALFSSLCALIQTTEKVVISRRLVPKGKFRYFIRTSHFRFADEFLNICLANENFCTGQ